MAETEDLYEILHLHPSAHPDVIQAAYRRLALVYHPDRNSSPEATTMMAAINRAYAVLSDPEQRAEYDRGRVAQGGAPASGTSGSSASSASQASRPGANAPRNPTGYFTLGSTKNDVADIHGPPHNVSIDQNIREEVWHYGSDDTIEFDLDTGRVQGWNNIRSNLRIRLVPGPNVTSVDYFTVGDHRDQIARLHGTPPVLLAIQESGTEVWMYRGTSEVNSVVFSFSTGYIIDWENRDGTLKAERSRASNDVQQSNPELTIYERLKEIIINQLGTYEADITPAASFRDDLNADSLDLVELLMAVEEEFSTEGNPLEIPDEDTTYIVTVGDAVAYLRERGIADTDRTNYSGSSGNPRVRPDRNPRARTVSNWRPLGNESNNVGIYTVDQIDPDYRLIVRFRNRDLELYIVWDTEVSYSESTTVNYQIDNGPTWRQSWHVSTDRTATSMPAQDIAETIRALFNAYEFTARVYPFGGSPITASFEVAGFLEAVTPVLDAWRRAGSPAPRVPSAEGGGCFLLPVSALSAVGVAASAIWVLL